MVKTLRGCEMGHFGSRVLLKLTILFKVRFNKFAPGKFQAIFNLIDIGWFAKDSLGLQCYENLAKLIDQSTGNRT